MNLKYGPYSPSRLNVAECGYAFKRQYIDKDGYHKKFESLPAARGSVVHEVFEKMTAVMRDTPDHMFNESEVRDYVVEAVNKHPTAFAETNEILRMAYLYANKRPELEPDAGIELRLAVRHDNATNSFVECGYDDPQAFARGRADIFMMSEDTTYAKVVDHKTQPNPEEADTQQLAFYAWVIMKTYPFLNEVHTVLHFARYGFYSDPFVWTKENLMQTEDEIVTKVTILENRTTWEATPNKHCQYCPFIAECPVMSEFVDIDAQGNIRAKPHNFKILGDTQKAIQVAGMVTVLSDLVNRGREGLRAHVKEYGPIAIPGVIYEYRGNEEVDWTKANRLREDVYRVFEHHGVDPKVFMGFSQTFTKSVWMSDNPRLVEDLAKVLPRRISSEFRGYKS